jgi:hypothetical protein
MVTVDTKKASVFRPGVPDKDTHPHACYGGLVFLSYVAYDEEIGDEVEHVEVVPCRRCAERGGYTL